MFLHDYLLACEISTVRTLVSRCKSALHMFSCVRFLISKKKEKKKKLYIFRKRTISGIYCIKIKSIDLLEINNHQIRYYIKVPLFLGSIMSLSYEMPFISGPYMIFDNTI